MKGFVCLKKSKYYSTQQRAVVCVPVILRGRNNTHQPIVYS